jgi:muramoyltetrapeptide carboxypeptidase LdcA involved in peptidoglycan recycling
MTKQFERFIDDVCVLVYAKGREVTAKEAQAVRESKNRLERHGADVVFGRVAKAQYDKAKEEAEAFKVICEAIGVEVGE